jgi:hypothetical protein
MYRYHGVLGRLKFAQQSHLCQSLVPLRLRKMKRYKAPGSDQIPAELIQAGGETLHSEIHKLIMLIWNKEEVPHQWKESLLYLFTKRVTKLTAVIIEAYHCCQFHTKFCLTSLR